MEASKSVLAAGLLSSLVVAMLAISSGSLWIDEFGTWILTRAGSVSEWWVRFEHWPDSDSQIPLYHFYMFLWTKVAGTGPIAMRASNIGMFLAANLALVWPFRSQRTVAIALTVTSCLSAAAWYYLNEIRPYIMLYMGTCLMLGAAIEVSRVQRSPSPASPAILCVGAVVLSGASVLGIAWAGSAALFVLLYWMAIRRGSLSDLVKGNYFALVLATLCVAALLAHDVRMYLFGSRPVLLHESSVQTVIFSLYANAGLLGIGPGMLDLRANGAGALRPFLPMLFASTIVLGAVAVAGMLELRDRLGDRTLMLLVGCILLPVFFTIGLGFVLHWRVLARHLMPLVPLFSLLYAFGLARLWDHRIAGKIVTALFAIAMLTSSVSVRFAQRHAKDDYKRAAELAAAELERTGRVWWAADWRGASYYGLPISDQPNSRMGELDRHVHLVTATTFPSLAAQVPPVLILLSKPDSYDQQGQVTAFLEKNSYRLVDSFPAFTAWRR